VLDDVFNSSNLVAIYDFELFPYSLGDILSWCIHTSIRCEELGKKYIDIYLCLDQKHPTSIFQRSLITSQNYDIFFNEVYTTFSLHPKLGNIFIFHERKKLFEQLDYLNQLNHASLDKKAIAEYRAILKKHNIFSKEFEPLKRRRTAETLKFILNDVLHGKIRQFLKNDEKLTQYFSDNISAYKEINHYYNEKKYIPLFTKKNNADIDGFIASRLSNKKIVTFHLRLRKLDGGYGGECSYHRDSDFLAWYEFLKEAATRYPDVIFIAVGRLQEKPLMLLRLPNVLSLRVYGMGLSHELSLILRGHLFIGTSSGFAVLANFSNVPYFITKMHPDGCKDYGVALGEERLPFAKENQKLVYEKESPELFCRLIEEGLKISPSVPLEQPKHSLPQKEKNISSWETSRSSLSHMKTTTWRFYHDDEFSIQETIFLLTPYLDKVKKLFSNNEVESAKKILARLEKAFPDISQEVSTMFPQKITT